MQDNRRVDSDREVAGDRADVGQPALRRLSAEAKAGLVDTRQARVLAQEYVALPRRALWVGRSDV